MLSLVLDVIVYFFSDHSLPLAMCLVTYDVAADLELNVISFINILLVFLLLDDFQFPFINSISHLTIFILVL